MGKSRAIFLDRDGVINRPLLRDGKTYPPPSLEQLEIYPDVSEALMHLKKLDFFLFVVTNQPDVGRGNLCQKKVEEIHHHLQKQLPIDEIFVSYDEQSLRYKPHPGMLLEAADKYQLCLTSSYMVGDRWRDIDAGKAAGCRTILVDHFYTEGLNHIPDFKVTNLLAAAKIIADENFCRYS